MMTRKRFVKLLMSQGYDRNGANAMADIVRHHNQSYATGYKAARVGKQLITDTIPLLIETMKPAVEALTKIANACAAGISASGRAYHSAMSEIE